MNTTETSLNPISEHHILEYVARISKDLTVLAEAEGLEFLAYLLNMAHQESSEALHSGTHQAAAE